MRQHHAVCRRLRGSDKLHGPPAACRQCGPLAASSWACRRPRPRQTRRAGATWLAVLCAPKKSLPAVRCQVVRRAAAAQRMPRRSLTCLIPSLALLERGWPADAPAQRLRMWQQQQSSGVTVSRDQAVLIRSEVFGTVCAWQSSPLAHFRSRRVASRHPQCSAPRSTCPPVPAATNWPRFVHARACCGRPRQGGPLTLAAVVGVPVVAPVRATTPPAPRSPPVAFQDINARINRLGAVHHVTVLTCTGAVTRSVWRWMRRGGPGSCQARLACCHHCTAGMRAHSPSPRVHPSSCRSCRRQPRSCHERICWASQQQARERKADAPRRVSLPVLLSTVPAPPPTLAHGLIQSNV